MVELSAMTGGATTPPVSEQGPPGFSIPISLTTLNPIDVTSPGHIGTSTQGANFGFSPGLGQQTFSTMGSFGTPISQTQQTPASTVTSVFPLPLIRYIMLINCISVY